MKHDFSLQAYQDIIQNLLKQGYSVKNFETASSNKKHLILRHDIDMSLGYAVQMAKCEQSIGVQATYFVLIRSDLYNCLTAENKDCMNEIVSMGHSIGLHFDASLYEQTPEALEIAVAQECTLLQNFIGTNIKMVSFHRPAKNLYGYAPKLAGRMHAYQPKFFNDMEYCSDSNGDWHHGHPLDRSLDKAMQLLTHPIWWVSKKDVDTQSKLDTYVENKIASFKQSLADNCASYKKP